MRLHYDNLHRHHGRPAARWAKPSSSCPATPRPTPTGPEPLHDDRLISAALIAEADKLLRDGKLLVGRAESIISESYDPLNEPPGEYYDPLEYLPNW